MLDFQIRRYLLRELGVVFAVLEAGCRAFRRLEDLRLVHRLLTIYLRELIN